LDNKHIRRLRHELELRATKVVSAAALSRLAKEWGVSMSEVIRRLIRSAAPGIRDNAEEDVAAWKELQALYAATSSSAHRWSREARAKRRQSSARRQPRDK
jgi:hypothetical protein